MPSETVPTLETGWEMTTPVDDSVLRHGVLALAAAWKATGELGAGRIHRDEELSAVDLGRPTGMLNSAMLLRPLRDEAVGDAVDRIERFYDAHGAGTVLLWSPWQGPDLTGQGWSLQGHPPLLYRPAGLPVERRRPAGLVIEEVETATTLAEWCAVAVDAFPLTEVDAPHALFDPAVLNDARFRFIAGRVAGRTVAVGCQVLVADANVLLLSTVRPDERGRGYYAALVADRLAQAPHLPSVTIVSDDSRPVLVGRFGFLPIMRFTLWERERP